MPCISRPGAGGGQYTVPHSNGTVGHNSQPGGLSSEVRSAVKSELDSILVAPAFSQSNRCKRFLSYIVQETLSGNLDQLKERIIGVKVFDRAYDYDTGDDSIVRVTANEVRKRIGQFYQESSQVHPIQIDLPRGSYVPEFRIHPVNHGHGHEDDHARGHEEAVVSHAALPAEGSAPPPPLPSPAHTEVPAPAAAAAGRAGATRRVNWVFASIALPVVAIAVAALTWGILGSREKRAVPRVWDAFASAKTPVLVCLGTHNIPDQNAALSSTPELFSDAVLRRDIIPIDDAAALSSIVRMLGKKGVPFRIVGAEKTSLTALQEQPVILIGAMDNQWSIQLTQGMRYRIAASFPAGPDKPPVATITDAEKPSQVWKVDFSAPMSTRKADYAIVAREDDATLGVPVLIVAGLGNLGTLAASALVTSDALTAKLAAEPACHSKSSFEAVVGTTVAGGGSGPPSVLRLACW